MVDEKAHPERRIAHGLWSALEDVKYGQLPGLKLSELDFCPFVTLELLEYENGRLHLDASVDRFLIRQEHMELRMKQDGKTVPLHFTKRFGGARFFRREDRSESTVCSGSAGGIIWQGVRSDLLGL